MYFNYFKKKAIKQYLIKQPKLLKKDYGSFNGCTPSQIEATITRHKLNQKYSYLACFMFVDRQSFESSRFGTQYDYQEIEKEYVSSSPSSNSMLSNSVDFIGGDGGNDLGGSGD
ncbi:DUF6559 family protein [Pseudoalteromonas sp. PB2-1]|uniref:DUF6559 family protein n=1 Tax=Pseudoalteromonas sp. PB2-1 TaxID=2907242 RepID=UPI0037038640